MRLDDNHRYLVYDVRADLLCKLPGCAFHLASLPHHGELHAPSVLRDCVERCELVPPKRPVQDVVARLEPHEALDPPHGLLRESRKRVGERLLRYMRPIFLPLRAIVWVMVRFGVGMAAVRMVWMRALGAVWRGVPFVDRHGLHLVVVVAVGEVGRAELEERRVEPHDEAGVDAVPALALDLGRGVVERVEVVDEDVELALRHVLPFVLRRG